MFSREKAKDEGTETLVCVCVCVNVVLIQIVLRLSKLDLSPPPGSNTGSS